LLLVARSTGCAREQREKGSTQNVNKPTFFCILGTWVRRTNEREKGNSISYRG